MRLRVIVVVSDSNVSILRGRPRWRFGCPGILEHGLFCHMTGNKNNGSWVSFLVFCVFQRVMKSVFHVLSLHKSLAMSFQEYSLSIP